jgi:16S rRNA (guanine527-N7)-methyltransferase
MSLAAALAQGVAGLGVELAAETQGRLLDYLALLQKWNKVYNLTAVREPQKMVSHHLLDCLAVLPHITARTILDVGSGAGLPGVPLAVALPHAQVTLLDSSHKKAAFLKQVVIELGLQNATVICQRVEAWLPQQSFELVISRAFSDLSEYLRLAGRLCERCGAIAALKGVYPYEELTQLPREFKLKHVVPLKVPGLCAERHLVLVQRA